MEKKYTIKKYTRGEGFSQVVDRVAVERPLTIFLNSLELITLMCSPQHLDELGIGYLVAEGLIKKNDNIRVSVEESKGLLQVEADEINSASLQGMGRRTITTGCGKGAYFYHLNDRRQRTVVEDPSVVRMDEILEGMKEFQKQSQVYRETGGVHGAALKLLGRDPIFREDVGRHNAVDKLLGHCALQKYKTEGAVLFLSGRISSEIVIKGGRIGIPILVSRSAPTSLAIDIALDLGLTLVGFARGRSANIYSHGERIE